MPIGRGDHDRLAPVLELALLAGEAAFLTVESIWPWVDTNSLTPELLRHSSTGNAVTAHELEGEVLLQFIAHASMRTLLDGHLRSPYTCGTAFNLNLCAEASA